MLPIPSSMDYVPLIIAGVLVMLFTIEHVIALLQGKDVVPSWNPWPDGDRMSGDSLWPGCPRASNVVQCIRPFSFRSTARR